MKTRGAICWNPGAGKGWSVEDIEIDPPRSGEVLVKLAASGLCHSDDHIDSGVYVGLDAMLGGHEGAGVVEEVGPEVTGLAPGDHVVLAFIPSCGRCFSCVSGRTHLCDLGAHLFGGVALSDGQHRVKARGQGVGTMCLLGTFAPYAVVNQANVIKIRDDVPLDKAALVGCGVTTGWDSAFHTAGTEPGDTVVVLGTGGIGMNAVQGARYAGAKHIVAVDTVEFKRDKAKEFGATHTTASIEDALPLVRELTDGTMAQRAVLTTSIAEGRLVEPALQLVGKRGVLVVTSVAPGDQLKVDLDLFVLTCYEKQIRGGLFGSSNPRIDIPRLLDLYMDGELKLDELVTKTYPLDEINKGYQDMLDGRNIRGLISYAGI
ncbi:NDMA-dependent alcohol dehydrogenase [Qaidamihabitans albus]|uniref:NDMA-dependent alcohol dehydrogenase n=1 Tax=Qaidamihabitans albus TaxID=2795733 RepID=UPI0018F153D4|nr:NDMA-dependent alcohol dehydrogenase [Qaidamihabitans albus]